ncbi:MAG: GNAT family N-acetyltransferase [Anaerolineae bacterium]
MSTLQKQLGDFAIYELTHDDWRRMKSMIDVFTQLMPEYAHYVNRLEESTQKTGPDHADHLHHVWLIEVEDRPAGMAAFEYVRRWDAGLGMDIAIFPSYRQYRLDDGRHIAHAILDSMVEGLQIDAQRYGKHRYIPMGGEVKYPRLMERFQSYGMIKLLVDYWEPPDVSGQADVKGYSGRPEEIEELRALGFQPMNLGIFIPKDVEFDIDDPEMWARVIRAFHIDHYQLQEDSRALQIALHSIKQLQLSKIVAVE